MEIFIFQIAVFAIIFLSAFFGREALNKTVLIVSVFTLLAVFMTWLIILQFITIVISYSLAVAQINRQEEITERQSNYRKYNPESGSSNNSGCFSALKLIMIALCIYFAYSVWSNKNKTSKNIETEIVEQPQNYNNPNNFKVDTLSIISGDENIEYSVEDINNQLVEEEQEVQEQGYGNISNDEDAYDPFADDPNYFSDESYARSGEFKLAYDLECSILVGKLKLEEIGNRKIKFYLEVGNNRFSGTISGVAHLTEERSRAIFKSETCKSLILDFLPNGEIRITETNCNNYHGTNICFDSVFK